MSPERWEKGQYQIGFEEVLSYAKENMLTDGRHMPTFVVEGSKNVIASRIQDMPETHGAKVELMRFLGQQTAMSGRIDQLEQVFMISEAWMAAASKDETAKIRPADDPNRKEILIISGVQMRERKKNIKLFEILRDSNEQVVDLEEFALGEKKDESVENPLLDAFIHGFQEVFQTKYN